METDAAEPGFSQTQAPGTGEQQTTGWAVLDACSDCGAANWLPVARIFPTGHLLGSGKGPERWPPWLPLLSQT
ncbi:hypothetical protein P7K49_015660 [Saguinus oedipus]|uniref:Uncharacterized protein n=1 Tax=Saguinus oedipus TaxID=9490 RepID=A0ABQ9VAG9_SAGOE|nr:hypothetical protein P7K49_015660 [Saguinus oedipus]